MISQSYFFEEISFVCGASTTFLPQLSHKGPGDLLSMDDKICFTSYDTNIYTIVPAR